MNFLEWWNWWLQHTASYCTACFCWYFNLFCVRPWTFQKVNYLLWSVYFFIIINNSWWKIFTCWILNFQDQTIGKGKNILYWIFIEMWIYLIVSAGWCTPTELLSEKVIATRCNCTCTCCYNMKFKSNQLSNKFIYILFVNVCLLTSTASIFASNNFLALTSKLSGFLYIAN